MADNYMEQSLDFASYTQKGFASVARRKDRGVRQAGFLVLRKTAMPSVLIELGYINNPAEAKYLSSITGQRSMASAIYSGLQRYIEDFDKKSGGLSTSSSPTVSEGSTAVLPEKKSIVEYNSSKSAASQVQVVEVPDAQRWKSTQFVSKNKRISELDVKSQVGGDAIVREQAPAADLKDSSSTSIIGATTQRPSSSSRFTNKSQSTPATKVDESRPAPGSKSNYRPGDIEYRVQILTASKILPNGAPQFKGLSPVDVYEDDNTYKYTYGIFDNERDAVNMRNTLRSKFKDAFIVRFKDGVRVK
jgi:N-acetylmuramoyl-L-alanine amidase